MEQNERQLVSLLSEITPLYDVPMREAKARQDALAKPPGSLGLLEDLSVQLAGITGQVKNEVSHTRIYVLAADNGVVCEGVSSAPQSVTRAQAINLTRGLTGASCLAKHFGDELVVADMGIALPYACPEILNRSLGKGTANIAAVCRELDCKMMYISTDYVFNGQGETPWDPDCKDYQPLNVYGQSKLGGELAVSGALEKYFIVRIAWVFGLNGSNFIKTMLQLGRTHDKLRVVCDQIGTPTYTLDLARLLVDMIESDKYGYYHATNEGGYISWYDFACEIFRQAGLPVQVDAVTTAEYGASKAARPFNSRLDKSKLAENGFTPLPEWKDALSRYLRELGDNQ